LKASTGDSRWSIILEWTAPSDSGKTVFAYDIRYNTVPITDSNWNDSTSVSYVPSPETPGTVQTMTVEMPDPNTDYYFAVKSSDSAGNLSSATSSSKTGSTPNGDFNCNSELDLPDVVIALQIQASMDVISSCLSDINGDKKTGLEEVIYILQKLAGIKE